MAAAAGLMVAAGPAAAELAERRVTLKDQKEVAVTIYNRNLALIKELRTVELKAGRNLLAFIDVSGRMRPETATLRAVDGSKIRLIEQNFNFDIMSRAKLLEKSVGREIRIIKVHPRTGEETVIKAKVLSARSGVVLQIGDRIETGIPGRIVFDKIPPNMRARPTLVVEIEAEKAGPATIELSYLSRALSWRADYVGELGAKDEKLQLNAWVTLTNKSGTHYRDATLQLVAGDVNRVRSRLGGTLSVRRPRAGAQRKRVRRETFFDYHLYTLDRKTSVMNAQIKQVALMSAPAVSVSKEYILQGGNYFRYRYAGVVKRPINVWLRFANDKDAGLGLPLPGGVMRIYKRDSKGKALFVGEDRIQHTPEGGKVRLRLGKAFDVTATRRQTDYTREGFDRRTYETAHEITLKNAKTEAVEVKVREPVPGDWRVLNESLKHRKVSAGLVEWSVKVPAKGEVKLTYRVRVRY